MMHARFPLFTLCFAICSGSCTTSESHPVIDAAAGHADSAVVVTPETRTLRVEPIVTAPGSEETRCIVLDLNNETPMLLRGITVRLDEGSHHLIVSRTTDSVAPTPTPCGAFAHGTAQAIFIAQRTDSGLRYPEGSGLPVAPHQHIAIEMHYINYFSSEPRGIGASVEFELEPVPSVFDEVHILFTGPVSLYLPARMETTVTEVQALPPGARVIGLTTHTHQLGTYASLRDVDGALLQESTDWAEPPLAVFDPPLRLGEVELTCVYDNTTDRDVTFGTGFADEMCFFWAYYLD